MGVERVVGTQRQRVLVHVVVAAPRAALARAVVGQPHPEIAPGVAGAGVHAVVAFAAGQQRQPAFGGRRRRAREEVHRPADGIAAVERRRRPADYLDLARARQVHLVERVVVEHAHRPDRHAILKVLVDRIGRDRLADAHAVLLVAEVHHVHAREGVDDLVDARRLGVVERARFQPADGRGRGRERRGLARAGDDDFLNALRFFGQHAGTNGECRQRADGARETGLRHENSSS